MANVSRRSFLVCLGGLTASVTVAGVAKARELTMDEKTVIYYNKVITEKTEEASEELFRHVLKYPDVTDIEKLRRYWRGDDYERVAMNLKKYIPEIQGIVPIFVARSLISFHDSDIGNGPVLKQFINRYSDIIAKA